MPQRKTSQKTEFGGVQLGASTARWHLEHDHIDLSPHHRPIGRLLKLGTADIPVVEDTRRMALLIVDMQNDFCSTGGGLIRLALRLNVVVAQSPGFSGL